MHTAGYVYTNVYNIYDTNTDLRVYEQQVLGQQYTHHVVPVPLVYRDAGVAGLVDQIQCL